MFGISFEHIVILGIILLIVGPRRLPELGNTMGKAIKNFKDSFSGIEEASFKRVNEKSADKPAESAMNAAAAEPLVKTTAKANSNATAPVNEPRV